MTRRMVWERHVSIIIMLSDIYEGEGHVNISMQSFIEFNLK